MPLRDAHGNILKWYGTLTDIEDRKKAEQERERLRRLQADLAHVNRVSMMGELTASLSHELKQPIAAAILNASACLRWLKREQPDVEEAREATMRIVKDGNRAAEIIDRLRSFYKKGSPPECELVDVNDVVREMLVLLRSEATENSVSMRTELSSDLPAVRADRVQLQQVCLNLMLNAIEAMKETGGELTIRSGWTDDGQYECAQPLDGLHYQPKVFVRVSPSHEQHVFRLLAHAARRVWGRRKMRFHAVMYDRQRTLAVRRKPAPEVLPSALGYAHDG